MSEIVTLYDAVVANGRARRLCAVNLLVCDYREGEWQRDDSPVEEALRYPDVAILLEPQSAADAAAWQGAFQGQPPCRRVFHAKIKKRTELLCITWLPQPNWLPVGITPTPLSAGPHGSYWVTVERTHWRVRQRMLAMQDVLLEQLRAIPGVAAIGSPPAVPSRVVNAVEAVRLALKEITKKPRDYVTVDQQITGGKLGAKWRRLSSALRRTGHPSAVSMADRLDTVVFPQSAPIDPSRAGMDSSACIDGMFEALRHAAQEHARLKVEETLRLSSLVSDRRAAREFFFSSLESVYKASKDLAPMTTSSTGAASFQRGVHGAVIEEAFRVWLRTRVSPLAVSTGTIIGAPAKDQLDVIIWDPRYIADVVRVGDVAYVPASAVRGILEVKGGHPSPGEVAQRLYRIQAVHRALCLGAPRSSKEVPILGVLVTDPTQYETVSGKGAGLVVALFMVRGTALQRNDEAFSRLVDFLHDVGEYAASVH